MRKRGNEGARKEKKRGGCGGENRKCSNAVGGSSVMDWCRAQQGQLREDARHRACLFARRHIERHGSTRQCLDRNGEWLVLVIVAAANERGRTSAHGRDLSDDDGRTERAERCGVWKIPFCARRIQIRPAAARRPWTKNSASYLDPSEIFWKCFRCFMRYASSGFRFLGITYARCISRNMQLYHDGPLMAHSVHSLIHRPSAAMRRAPTANVAARALGFLLGQCDRLPV